MKDKIKKLNKKILDKLEFWFVPSDKPSDWEPDEYLKTISTGPADNPYMDISLIRSYKGGVARPYLLEIKLYRPMEGGLRIHLDAVVIPDFKRAINELTLDYAKATGPFVEFSQLTNITFYTKDGEVFHYDIEEEKLRINTDLLDKDTSAAIIKNLLGELGQYRRKESTF